ncbi:hypothetical protein [Pseudolactococcus paracarnosus]|uniref:Uncharacterized protein n=2 Tax=Pseudolactococcus paracarnosus TaxID=2749962 RepID=A0ABT0AKJ9_9LACT|nr:hypothetical protein [Lactococcus paracarnosus]SPC35478.1 hypothetical protein LPICM02_180001 [Lactococcus piscium]MCJ1977082.1 hypothetical protein [Lactococcus paracarnosus]MCJ1983118.1 hypothetical protein [Lactococcus paracarnosus]MCJ1993967.1 hypothetical protein [Lactococcus paracarnosus]MCJ1997215.1 hypothetical protein [Lactococcus paracarnosus]
MEMVMPSIFIEMKDEEMMYVDGGGFVGVNIRVSKATGKRGAETCGILAAGAVAYPLYLMSVGLGPAAAVASTIIAGSTRALVVNAVKSGRFTIPVGVDIPFMSWSRTVVI